MNNKVKNMKTIFHKYSWISLLMFSFIVLSGCSVVMGKRESHRKELSEDRIYVEKFFKYLPEFEEDFNEQEAMEILNRDFSEMSSTYGPVVSAQDVIEFYFKKYDLYEMGFNSFKKRQTPRLTIMKTLKMRKGVCIELSILLLIYFEEFNIECWAVTDLSSHFFVRYRDEKGTLHNCETTIGGKEPPNTHYINEMRMLANLDDIKHGGKYELTPEEAYMCYFYGRVNNSIMIDDNYNKYSNLLDKLEEINTYDIIKVPIYILKGLVNGGADLFKYLNKALAIDPESLLANYSKADALLQSEKYHKAESIISLLEREYPDNQLVHEIKSFYFYKQRKYQKALERNNMALEKMIEDVKRKSHDFYYLRARIFRALNRLKEAKKAIKKAIAIYPAVGYYQLKSTINYELGEYREAEKDLKYILSKDPDNEQAKNNMKVIKETIKQKNLQQKAGSVGE